MKNKRMTALAMAFVLTLGSFSSTDVTRASNAGETGIFAGGGRSKNRSTVL